MRFLCKRAIVWSHEELMVSHLCESVSCEIITILNKCNQSLEGKKNLLCRRLLRKNSPPGNFVQQRQEIRPKSVRHHTRAVRAE